LAERTQTRAGCASPFAPADGTSRHSDNDVACYRRITRGCDAVIHSKMTEVPVVRSPEPNHRRNPEAARNQLPAAPAFLYLWFMICRSHHSMPGGFGSGCPTGRTISGGRRTGCGCSLSEVSVIAFPSILEIGCSTGPRARIARAGTNAELPTNPSRT
jgi:hypothetical protein